jgi:hypothetical protein
MMSMTDGYEAEVDRIARALLDGWGSIDPGFRHKVRIEALERVATYLCAQPDSREAGAIVMRRTEHSMAFLEGSRWTPLAEVAEDAQSRGNDPWVAVQLHVACAAMEADVMKRAESLDSSCAGTCM